MILSPPAFKQPPKTAMRSHAACGKLCSIVFAVLTIISCFVSSQTLHAQTKVNVSNLSELREAIQRDNLTIVMKPGRYSLTELPKNSRNITVSGSNNSIDLTDVYVAVPVGSTDSEYISISGNGNVFRGGNFEDLYSNGLDEVTDFSAYNKDRRNLARGLGGDAVFGVHGDNNKVVNTKLTVRGSFPYGYGSIYGIGAGNAFGLNKRCGLVVRGKRNTVDGVEIQQRAFGHGIFIQKPSNETVVKNCLVEGRMRPSKDLYLETDPEDLPVRSKYRMKDNRDPDRNDGPPIPKDTMLPLSEDGIRVYSEGGSVTVENCTVKMMRGGVRTYLSRGATVSGCLAIDCGLTNFNLPSNGQITASTGNFAFAPLIDFPGTKSGQVIQLTIAPSPRIAGPHNIAEIDGKNHKIIFRRLPGPVDTNLRPIVISTSKSTIRNETEYPIKLESSATNNTVFSFGPVVGRGSDNTIQKIKPTVGDTGESNSGDNEFRIWESKDGVKVLAKLIAKKGSSVTLGKIDGMEVTGRLRDLSKADREYIANLDKAPPTEDQPSKTPPTKTQSEPSIRTWTSTFGSKIEARLVRRSGDSVILEKADGKSLTVPMDKLSKDDQDYVQTH